MSTDRYMKILTEKGLIYIINHSDKPAEVEAAKKELRERRNGKDIRP